MTRYIHEGKTYQHFWELKRALPNVAFSPDTPADLMAKLGVTILEEPEQEPVADPLAEAKQRRREEVATIEVEVDGMAFDGDEVSQRRMTAALLGWDESEPHIQWVLADNTLANVTKDLLARALRLSVARMREAWVAPYATDTEAASDLQEA